MSSNKKLLQGASGFINQSGGLNVEDVFSCDLALGVPGGSVTINNGIDLSGEGGAVWLKNREITADHYIVDTVRGAGTALFPSANSHEQSATDGPTSFSSNGFSTGSSPANDHVYWTFRQAENFFQCITYSGSSSTQTIAHNLGSVPGMVMVKQRNSSGRWNVWHRSLSSSNNTPYYGRVALNTSDAYAEYPTISSFQYLWGEANPTATNFTVGPHNDTSDSGSTYVAYLFAHHNNSGTFGSGGDQDIIKCDTFTTDSSGNYDGSTALGFEPQWLMVKAASTTGHWFIHDSLRGISDSLMTYLLANSSNAESSFSAQRLRLTSQGFVFEGGHLEASDTYIYMAIRKAPMATPTSTASVFAKDFRFSSNAQAESPKLNYYSGFPVDFDLNFRRSSGGVYVSSRLQGGSNFLQTNTDAAEVASSSDQFGSNKGLVPGFTNSEDTTMMSAMWRRAPNFFEVVTWKGDGTTNRSISHNLGQIPAMIWGKTRTATTLSGVANWNVLHKSVTMSGTGNSSTGGLNLNTDNAADRYTHQYEHTYPTSSVIKVSHTAGAANQSLNESGGTYVAFLFGEISGISKAGSFSHTNGSSTDVDCGFSSGSSFVIVKRTDATGDWYVWDSKRGIVTGDDPYLLLNSSAAEVTNTDLIDPLNSGFQIASGFTTGSYIFYAIAT